MRESIGATYIFTICLVFILLFTAYLAVSVNYSKAFKIKSYIVSQIDENREINKEVIDDIKSYLIAQGYTAYGKCEEINNWELTDDSIDDWAPDSKGQKNVCIYRHKISTSSSSNDDINIERYYYKVVTFFKFDIPIINTLLTFNVSGDTKYIIPKQPKGTIIPDWEQ